MVDPSKWFTSLSDLGKVPTRIIVFVFISCGLILMLPQSVAAKLRLDSFVDSYGSWIGLAFLLSSVFLLGNFGAWLIKKWNAARALRKQLEKILSALSRLDHAEKAVLREYFIQGQSTIRLPIDEPIVAGLIRKGILQRVGELGSNMVTGLVFPVTISHAADQFITDELVELPMNPTEAEKARILQLRPAFVEQILALQDHRLALFRRTW